MNKVKLTSLIGLTSTLVLLSCVSSVSAYNIDDTTSRWCNGTVGSVRTALGCVNASDPQSLVSQIAGWALGLAAGAAFVTIAYSGFLITTAQGDAKKVNEAKTFLMSALLGLLLISIALVLLNFVGVNVLSLDSFGFGV